MEKTLILLKPDCTTRRLCGEVIARFEKAGLQILACKMLKMTPEVLREHYAHIVQKPFYPEVEEFMLRAPVIGLVLSGEDAVAKVRLMIGPTDSRKADKGTVRGDFGLDSMENIVHASESPEAAALEIDRFFNPREIFSY